MPLFLLCQYLDPFLLQLGINSFHFLRCYLFLCKSIQNLCHLEFVFTGCCQRCQFSQFLRKLFLSMPFPPLLLMFSQGLSVPEKAGTRKTPRGHLYAFRILSFYRQSSSCSYPSVASVHGISWDCKNCLTALSHSRSRVLSMVKSLMMFR